MVSGTAALALSVNPQPMANLRATILAAVDLKPSMVGKTVTGGMLNACKALPGCGVAPVAAPSPIAVLSICLAAPSPALVAPVAKTSIAVSIALALTTRPRAAFVWSLRLRHRLRGGTRIRTAFLLLGKTRRRTACEKH